MLIVSIVACLISHGCGTGDAPPPVLADSPIPVTARDAAAVAAGFDYIHSIPDRQSDHFEQIEPYMSAGAAAGDYDNDGWVDLFVTRVDRPNLLFRNRGNGTFERDEEAGVGLSAVSSGCTWGDVNNDGWLDLYVLSLFGRNYLYINDGHGRFVERAIESGVAFDGDPHARWTGAAFGDYDRDGDLDLNVVSWGGSDGAGRLMQNDGTGVFADVTAQAGASARGMWGFAPAFADFDGDGWLDLAIAADFHTSRLFRNNRDGTFTNVTAAARVGTDEFGMGSAVGDVDNDGDLDWFVTSIYALQPPCEIDERSCDWNPDGNRLYRNDGGMRFTDATDAFGLRDGAWGWAASYLDYDNDGDLDLAMTNGMDLPYEASENVFNADTSRLWRNDGGGAMTDISDATGFADSRAGKGLVVFDFDRDGDLDVFVANSSHRPLLLRNRFAGDNGWLRVELRGAATNHFGLGVRVRVQVVEGGPVQLREINANSNYMSHNELTAHCGLGAGVDRVYAVTVNWPVSGTSQTFLDLKANQTIRVTEFAQAYTTVP